MSAAYPPHFSRETVDFLRSLFAYRTLHVRQKLLSISQKYYVTDEHDLPRFFVVRPPKLFLAVAAGFAAFAISILALVLAIRVLLSSGNVAMAIAIMIAGRIAGGAVGTLMKPYRDIAVYTDESQQFQIMLITQDNKFGFFHRFTLHDPAGQPLAVAKRNYFLSMLRRQWSAETMGGEEIVKIREDAVVLALLRRYLGPLWGLLRTNFDFIMPGGTRIGEYNRKLTLTDQYVLDLGGDPAFLVDRRVTLGIAILLDTAEGR